MAHSIERLLFVGFNSRVAALDVATGTFVWSWKSPNHSGGYVTLLLQDEQHLIAAVDGYIFCLDPASGSMIWFNETKGFGTGVTSMVSLRGRTLQDSVVAAAAVKAAQAQAASADSAT